MTATDQDKINSVVALATILERLESEFGFSKEAIDAMLVAERGKLTREAISKYNPELWCGVAK